MSKKYTTETFKEKANDIQGGRYDYSLVEYVNNRTKVPIIFSIHGVFYQTPNGHLSGQGCKKCSNQISNQEKIFIGFIKSVYNNSIITNTRDIIKPYELDVYLPDKQLAFEYNGTYWHEEGVTKPMGYHQMKTDMCRNKGIELTHIWEKDWMNDKQFMKECIKRIIL